MTAAAIAAQLVDMRNVGTHKVLKLTIHIPEEQALAAIAAFGWPTGVDPVPIAIARLNPNNQKEEPRQEPSTPDGAKTKTAFRDMRPANQAGILCDKRPFQRFLAWRLKYIDREYLEPHEAADRVRQICGVDSRSDIRPRTPSGDKWQKLFSEYQLWMHEPDLVPSEWSKHA